MSEEIRNAVTGCSGVKNLRLIIMINNIAKEYQFLAVISNLAVLNISKYLKHISNNSPKQGKITILMMVRGLLRLVVNYTLLNLSCDEKVTAYLP